MMTNIATILSIGFFTMSQLIFWESIKIWVFLVAQMIFAIAALGCIILGFFEIYRDLKTRN